MCTKHLVLIKNGKLWKSWYTVLVENSSHGINLEGNEWDKNSNWNDFSCQNQIIFTIGLLINDTHTSWQTASVWIIWYEKNERSKRMSSSSVEIYYESVELPNMWESTKHKAERISGKRIRICSWNDLEGLSKGIIWQLYALLVRRLSFCLIALSILICLGIIKRLFCSY